MSVEKFEELKKLVSLEESNLVGFALYFLEEENNKLNPIKIEISSEDMEVEDSMLGLENKLEDINLVNYLEETDISPEETIGLINEEYLESVTRIKETIINGDSLDVMSKRDSMNNVKGLVVHLKLKDNSNYEEDVFLYSQITRGHVYKKKPLWSINIESEVILKKIEKPMINLNLNYCSIHYKDKVFVLHSHFFEQLFKFHIRFKKATEEVLAIVSDMNLISNFSEFETRCMKNKNFQRKLFHVKQSGRMNEILYSDFHEINERVGGILKIIFHSDSETISIDEEDIHQSTDQIIRIMNNEAAETIISQEAIFAGRKQVIE